jgi:hypothetical protein
MTRRLTVALVLVLVVLDVIAETLGTRDAFIAGSVAPPAARAGGRIESRR